METLPDDAFAAAKIIADDGAAMVLSPQDLVRLNESSVDDSALVQEAGESPVRHTIGYVYLYKPLSVIWSWRMSFGLPERLPMPELEGEGASLLKPLVLYVCVDVDQSAPEDISDPFTVLDWVRKEASGYATKIQGRQPNCKVQIQPHDVGDVDITIKGTESLKIVQSSVEQMKSDVENGHALYPFHWIELGRALERLALEAAEDNKGRTIGEKLRRVRNVSHKSRVKQQESAKLDRGQIEKEKSSILPVARAIRTENPELPRAKLAQQVKAHLQKTDSTGKFLNPRSMEDRLIELEKAGQLEPKGKKPRLAE